MDIKGLLSAVAALAIVYLIGAASGWHWRGKDFDARAQALKEQIERREAQRRADLEQALAAARAQVSIAERAAQESETQRAQTIDQIARSKADELDRVNAIIGEAGR